MLPKNDHLPLSLLRTTYPHLDSFFERLGALSVPEGRDEPVAEAVTRIVIGQMLSGAAASTIYARVKLAARDTGLTGSWLLSESDLAQAGLSRRKIRAIHNFGALYNENPNEVEAWRDLSYEGICANVKGCWARSQP